MVSDHSKASEQYFERPPIQVENSRVCKFHSQTVRDLKRTSNKSIRFFQDLQAGQNPFRFWPHMRAFYDGDTYPHLGVGFRLIDELVC